MTPLVASPQRKIVAIRFIVNLLTGVLAGFWQRAIIVPGVSLVLLHCLSAQTAAEQIQRLSTM
jgi:hypothetical protein